MALPTGCLGLDPGLRGLSGARADSARPLAHRKTCSLPTVVSAALPSFG